MVLVPVDGDGVPLAAPSIKTGETLALELEREPPFTLIAWAFAPEVLAPTCPVSFDQGLPLPADRTLWTASIVDREGDASFVEAADVALEVRSTCIEPRICPGLNVASVDVPEFAGGSTADVLVLSSSKVLLAGDQWSRILEIDGDARRFLDTSLLGGIMRTLVRDGDRVYGATNLEAFRFDLETETFEVETSTALRGLAVVPGGAPLIYGDFGLREAFTSAASATTSIERLQTAVHFIVMVEGDLGLLIDEDSAVYGFTGDQWVREEPASEGLTLENIKRADGDQTYFMTVGKRQNVFLRSSGSWRLIGQPFNDGSGLLDVQNLGGGRFFVVGDFGHGALFQDGGWCTYDLGTDQHVSRIALAPDGRTMFAGTDFREGEPLKLLRFTLE